MLTVHRQRRRLATRLAALALRCLRISALALATTLFHSRPVAGQGPARPVGEALPGALDSLIARALAASPAIRAANARLDAARARIGPAGARPDPMLMAGIQNLPRGREAATSSTDGDPMGTGGPDPMTMKMIGASQTILYPGKRALRRAVTEREVDAARVTVDMVRRQVVRDVKDAYYELSFIDRALAIIGKNEDVLGTFIRATEARYSVGVAGQQDVLRARVEAARLAETATTLTEQRRATLARLNAQLDRPSETPVTGAAIPEVLLRAAAGDSMREARFVSAALGARVGDSPLRPLAELQQIAIETSPELREHEAMITAQAARLELARKDHLPDFDVSVQYGQRTGRPDMVSAVVSIPVPLQRKRKQDQVVAEASALLASLNEEHQMKVNGLRSDVARLVTELERSRAQLAFTRRAILPQARASVASALASYQAGKVEFLTVLDNQSNVFRYETEYSRALTDFAKNIAELERIAGAEVLR